MASRWRHCADLTGPGIEPQTSRTDSVRLATELTAGCQSTNFHLMIFQANKQTPAADTKRNKSLRVLALQTAALLKWDLTIFDKELPIANRHQLLMELMKACKVSIPIAPQVMKNG